MFSSYWIGATQMGPMEDSQEGELLLSRLSESTKAISELSDCRNVCKKMYGNLVRRAKLLSPLFEELRDSEVGLDDDVVKAFESLRLGLDSATQLLNSVNGGSKLYLVLFLCFSLFLKWIDFCLIAENEKTRRESVISLFGLKWWRIWLFLKATSKKSSLYFIFGF